MSKPEYPPLLNEIRCFVQELLVAEQIQPELSEKISRQLAEKIRRKWGGRQLYIPTGRSLKADQRRQLILAAFNGRNQAELSQRFGISLQRVYQILQQHANP